MDFLAKLLANFAIFTADGSDKACPWLWIDEPETPKCLIK